MMDSNSVLVVKEKHGLSLSICIPLTGNLLVSYQIEISRLVAAAPVHQIFPVVTGAVRPAQPPSLPFLPFPSYKLL